MMLLTAQPEPRGSGEALAGVPFITRFCQKSGGAGVRPL